MIKNIEKLCNICGVSGDEDKVREYIINKITPLCDDIRTDSMGNVIALKKGASSDKKIMIAVHMDEVGFIVSEITDKGFIKFQSVGGIDPRVLVSKRVVIGDKRIKGVIGMKAVHLQNKSEREKAVAENKLTIDIGAKSKKDALKWIEIGDYISFATEFEQFGNGFIKGKALDNRVGCAVAMELLKERYDYDLYVCFTVQEEIGLRGATVAAYAVEPDIALVIETTTASDVSGTDEHQYVVRLNHGAAVTLMDSRTIVDKRLAAWLYENGNKKGIKTQYKESNAGGNDAGAIHLSKEGVKTCAISLPCRYLHSPVTVAAKDDVNSVYELSRLFLQNTKSIMKIMR